MAVVVVAADVVVSDGEGGVVRLRRGDAWDTSHPIVRLHPECFTPDVPRERSRRDVEQATAAPGERRGRG